MELWGKVVMWIIALIFVIVVIIFLVKELKMGNGGIIDTFFNIGKQPPS
jgi:hypothetical protein